MQRKVNRVKKARVKPLGSVDQVMPSIPDHPETPATGSKLEPDLLAIHVGPRLLYEPLLVSVGDAGQLLGGISRVTIYALFAASELHKVPVGRRTMIAYEDLRAFVARQLGEAS